MRPTTRRFACLLLIVLLALAGATGAQAASAQPAGWWSGTWSAAQQPPVADSGSDWSGQGFADDTLRQVVRISAGGPSVRIRLSNVYDQAPLVVTGATVGRAGDGAAVRPGTVRRVTFRHAASVRVAAGREVLSDAVALAVRPLQRLSITLYFAEPTGPATFHSNANATSYRAHGDHRADTAAAAFTDSTRSWYYLAGVDVPGTRGSIVTFGDSITDGFASTPEANNRYPDELAELLHGRRGVLNAGLSGNRLLNDSSCFGERGLTRYPRDVLGQPGVRTAVVLEGINDIQASDNDPGFTCFAPATEVTAAQLIAGYRQLIAGGHARGVRMVGATLLPYGGWQWASARGEAVRDAVNTWIRTSGAFDVVADLDRAMADPANPDLIDPALDSGDHLHPNDAGYHRMAGVVARALR